MKKILIFASMLVLVAALVTTVVIFASNPYDPSKLKMLTADRVNVKAEARLEISVDFLIATEDIDYLESEAENLRVYAVLVDYDKNATVPADNVGTTIELTRSSTRLVDAKRYYVYNLNLGVISSENYNKSYAVRGFISFGLDGSKHKIASDFTKEKNVITPYESVYAIYCDRSESKSDTHPYEAPDGTFSPVPDLNALRKILSSVLYLEIKDGKVTDTRENEYYTSLYGMSYFDGVLTLSLESGSFPEWLLTELYINGEARYFEIHNGRVRLVV